MSASLPNPAPAPTRDVSFLRRKLRRVRALLGRLSLGLKYEIHAYWRRRPVLPDQVFYESFAGNGMLCNPEAIFRALKDDPEFSGLHHIWSLTSRRDNRHVIKEFRNDPRVKFVRPRSVGYYRALATSGYLINNATFPPEFGKRDDQVYLNTWHGTPLKRMGYDIGDPASRVGNVIRNFLNADYLLASNDFTVERMYEGAHLLRGIYRGQVIEEGYPRIDRQIMTDAQIKATRDDLIRIGLDIGEREIILYAPTWKGTNFNRPEDDAAELIARVEELNSLVDTERYVVLLKTHQVVHKFAAHNPHLAGMLVPNEIPSNVVLGVTAVLVTDYSSIFFDFLATGRPIAFFAPDIDDYSGYRGLYMEPEEWPGVVTRTVPELARELNALAERGQLPEVAARYRAAQERFTPYEDGGATERVIDIVFRGLTDGKRIRSLAKDSRRSILINAGGMRPNGITASLLNLLDGIDHSRFDVSVVFPNSRWRLVLEKQAQLNPNARQFARVGGMNGSKFSHFLRRLAVYRGDLGNHLTDPVQRQLWDDEWKRCFGNSKFDFVVDFSGYSPFWSTLMLHAPDGIRSIWLHNDLAADAHRVAHGRRPHLRNLTSVFSLYREYDHLVSVSASLADINARKLAEHAGRDKFVSAPNLVNASFVLERSRASDEPPEDAADFVPAFPLDPQLTTFVSVGRLSQEKNHARLIRAFALVHAKDPATRLMIVGTGPLKDNLERLVASSGLGDCVRLVGHRANPYALMAQADCFVLSSEYEGQPMVLLEALVLDLPIVTVAFESAKDALPPGVGLVTEKTDDGLAAGMLDFLAGRVGAGHFDSERYNREAITQFSAAIGLDEAHGRKPAEESLGEHRLNAKKGT